MKVGLSGLIGNRLQDIFYREKSIGAGDCVHNESIHVKEGRRSPVHACAHALCAGNIPGRFPEKRASEVASREGIGALGETGTLQLISFCATGICVAWSSPCLLK